MATDNVRLTIYVPAEMKRRLQLEALDNAGNDVSAYARSIFASWFRLNDAVAVTLALQVGDTYDPDRLDALGDEEVVEMGWRDWPRRDLPACPRCPDTANPGCLMCERSRHVAPAGVSWPQPGWVSEAGRMEQRHAPQCTAYQDHEGPCTR